MGKFYKFGFAFALAFGGASCSPITGSQTMPSGMSMGCPFEGTEIILEVMPNEDGRSPTPSVMEETVAVVSSRLEEAGFSDAGVFAHSSDEVMVQLRDGSDLERVEDILSDQGRLSLRLQAEGTDADLRALMAEQQVSSESAESNETLHREILALFGPAELTSDDLRDAFVEPSMTEGIWQIVMELDEQGAETFAEMTQAVAGTGRSVGIFLDGVLINAPTVPVTYAETGITGGNVVISGAFREEQAAELVSQLKRGAFPAATEVVSVEAVRRDENCDDVES